MFPIPHQSSRDARRAVDNVLRGYTADGLQPIGIRLSFTTDDAARAAAADAIHTIAMEAAVLSPIHLTPLATKLLAYFSKTGRQTKAAIDAFVDTSLQTLTEALCEAPDLLFRNAGISAILRAHSLRALQRASQLADRLPARPPPRRVLWQQGPYRVEETTDPRHLQLDSAALGHCAGTLHHVDALLHHGIAPGSPDAVRYLRYWIAIRNGSTRILTLTAHGTPVATMHYDCPTKTILQIQARSFITGQEPFFKPLCAGLAALRRSLPLLGIPDIGADEQREPNTVLTAQGTYETPTRDNLPHALEGLVALIPGDNPFNDLACNNPLIDVEATALDQDDLDRIHHTAGSFVLFSGDPYLPNITRIGRALDLFLSDSCDMPKLTHIGGDVQAPCLYHAHLPALSTVTGDFHVPALTTGCLDSLTSVGKSKHAATFFKTTLSFLQGDADPAFKPPT